MADTNVRAFPEAAPSGIRPIIDASLVMRRILERAVAVLGQNRRDQVTAKIDAFAAKTAVTPADALRAQLELEALRKTFDDQEAALHFWEHEINERLGRLAVDSWAEMLEALDVQIAALKLLESKEQGEVDEVKSVISEFEDLRHELQKTQKRHGGGGGSSGVKRGSHKSEDE